VAIVKASYTKSQAGIKASVRYIQNRPGHEGERLTRTLFGIDGPLTRDQVYQMIDDAPKGTNFFRLILSPDPRGEDSEKDLHLRELTERVMVALAEELQQQIQYVGAIHDDHTAHRHVHVIALIQGKLTREHFRLMRKVATEVALLQRRERDLIRGVVREEPASKQRIFPRGPDPAIPAGGGPMRHVPRCPACGQENCLLHDLELELEQ
jgi:chromosome segregation and condensation protein ScpB